MGWKGGGSLWIAEALLKHQQMGVETKANDFEQQGWQQQRQSRKEARAGDKRGYICCMPRQLVSSLSYSLISIGDDVQPANSSPHPQTLPVQMYKCSPSQKGDGSLLLFNPMELEAVKSERGDHFMKEGA